MNSADTSVIKSTQLNYALPVFKLQLYHRLSVDMVADNADCKLKLKAFHSKIQNNYRAIAAEE